MTITEEEPEATAKAFYDMFTVAQKPLHGQTKVSQLDAIHLNGNVWINIPLRPGKMVSGMTARCERAVKGER